MRFQCVTNINLLWRVSLAISMMCLIVGPAIKLFEYAVVCRLMFWSWRSNGKLYAQGTAESSFDLVCVVLYILGYHHPRMAWPILSKLWICVNHCDGTVCRRNFQFWNTNVLVTFTAVHWLVVWYTMKIRSHFHRNVSWCFPSQPDA